MPSTFAYQSARVVESGRAIEVTFAADQPPSDPGTFVDRRLSLDKALTINGAKTRSSANLAGVSASRGRSEWYLFSSNWSNGYNASKSAGTSGETLTVRSGETVLGTIGPFTQDAEHPDAVAFMEAELRRIIGLIPLGSKALTDRWEFAPLIKTQTGDPPRSYKLAVSDGETTLTTGPIDYDTSRQGYTGDTAAEALRAVMGDRAVSGWNYYDYPLRAQIVFEREHCPFWPIQSVTVVEPSEPDLIGDPKRPDDSPCHLQMATDRGWHYLLRFADGLGARDLDLSISSDGPIFDGCLHRWIQGDDRWLWTATWYLDDPTEVIPFGETVTLSGPSGLLAGAVVDDEAGALAGTGDQTAAFTGQAVTNRSRAGVNGKLSGDLCRPRTNAEGITDGWARWRHEAPPSTWIPDDPRSGAGLDLPIRIAYVDPTYDGSNGPSRLNDPTRPYADITALGATGEGHYDLDGPSNNAITMATPRLILLKKGQTHTVGGSGILYEPCDGTGVSHDSPAILSSYWMDGDGPEPEEPARLVGSVSFSSSRDYEPGGYHDLIIHGIEWAGTFTTRVPFRDYSLWECSWVPGKSAADIQGGAVRFSMIRTTVKDAWKVSGSVTGMYTHDVAEGHLDQTAWIRNGFTNFPGGWDGELWESGDDETTKPTYLGVMSDVTAMPSEHDLPLSHNIYSQSGHCTPWLVTNNTGAMTTGVSFMHRTPAIVYGNAHYREGDFAQMVKPDDCTASRHGSHIRRNLFTQGVANAAINLETHGYARAGGALAVTIEDNLVLGQEGDGAANAIGIRGADLNATSEVRTILTRRNTVIDQSIQWWCWPLADSRLAPDLRVATLRNLLVRTTRETYYDILLAARYTPAGTAGLDWLMANANLYVVPSAGSTSFNWSLEDQSQADYSDLAAWRSATGQEADGVREVLTLQTSGGVVDGLSNPFRAYLASRDPSLTTEALCLGVLRDRKPEEWDDTLHAPLGDGTPTGGLIGFAEAALAPTNLDGVGSGTYGAVAYAGSEPDPDPGDGGDPVPPTTLTLTGPGSGTVGIESAAFTATLDHPAIEPLTVGLVSSRTGDTFRATSGGSAVTSITLPTGAASGSFRLVPSATGERTITLDSATLSIVPAEWTYTASEAPVNGKGLVLDFGAGSLVIVIAPSSS